MRSKSLTGWVVICMALQFASLSTVNAADINGTALLEGQIDHSGIIVALTGSLTIPSMSLWGIAIVAFILSLLLYRQRSTTSKVLSIIAILITCYGTIRAMQRSQTVTTLDGAYSFTDITPGYYRLEFEKPCYEIDVIDPVIVSTAPLFIPERTLLSIIEGNHRRTGQAIELIRVAEAHYSYNSSPHTYTGDLACLCSGNGAGGVSFLPEAYADGIADGYVFSLSVSMPSGSSFWFWDISAVPQVYECTGIWSFYSDRDLSCCPCTLNAGDIGGAPGHSGLPEVCYGNSHFSTQWSLMGIAAAQTDYNNNSSPHTYTGSLACLCSGNGAGSVPLLCSGLTDSESCLYIYQTGIGNYIDGSYWAWSTAAYPIVYGPESALSFYIDQTAVIRSGDIGGIPGDQSLPIHTPVPGGCFGF